MFSPMENVRQHCLLTSGSLTQMVPQVRKDAAGFKNAYPRSHQPSETSSPAVCATPLLEPIAEAMIAMESKIANQVDELKASVGGSVTEQTKICSHMVNQLDTLTSQMTQLEALVKANKNRLVPMANVNSSWGGGCKISEPFDIDTLAVHAGHCEFLDNQGVADEPTDDPGSQSGEGLLTADVFINCTPIRKDNSVAKKDDCLASLDDPEDAPLSVAQHLLWKDMLHEELAAQEAYFKKTLDKVELALQSQQTQEVHFRSLVERMESALQSHQKFKERANSLDSRSSCSMSETPAFRVGQIPQLHWHSHGSCPSQDDSRAIERFCQASRGTANSAITGLTAGTAAAMRRIREESQQNSGIVSRWTGCSNHTTRSLFSKLPSTTDWLYQSLGLKPKGHHILPSHPENFGDGTPKSNRISRETSFFDMVRFGEESHGAFANLMLGTDEGNVLAINHAAGRHYDCYIKGHWATKIIQNQCFKNSALWMTFFNAVFIAVQVDMTNAGALYRSHWLCVLMSNIFCIFYVAEWIIRFTAYEKKSSALTKPGHCVDTVLVVLAVSDAWVVEPLLLAFQGTRDDLTVLSAFKILWLARLARLLKGIPELLQFTRGIVMALKAVIWTFIMVVMLTFVFGVVLHTVLKDSRDVNENLGARNFESLRSTMWTLLIDGALLAEFGEKMTILMYSGSTKTVVACIILTAYMFIAALTTLNMLIGVMSEVVCTMTARERTESAIALVRDTILKHLEKHDDGDGLISKTELEFVMADPESEAVLRSLNVDKLFLCELQATLFPTVDSTIPIDRVVELMLLCRGDNVTTVRTLASGLLYIASLIHDLDASVQTARDRLDKKPTSPKYESEGPKQHAASFEVNVKS